MDEILLAEVCDDRWLVPDCWLLKTEFIDDAAAPFPAAPGLEPDTVALAPEGCLPADAEFTGAFAAVCAVCAVPVAPELDGCATVLACSEAVPAAPAVACCEVLVLLALCDALALLAL